ncbi:hypothetical protein ACFU99_00645 [Streptomyces sp. NPDC057654]|uniref:hypothetical protein n=1 Tax=Streptomyces sp. NPDC057654 TaxID=3346196 RepID=UPI0036B6FD09
MQTIMTLADIYEAMLETHPVVSRLIGGMTSISGMVLHFTHAGGDHIIQYHCSMTDGRQHRKHFEVIPEGYEFLGTTPIRGNEYTPEGGGDRFADIYYRPQTT